MNDSLAVYTHFDQLERAAKSLQQSGYFKDVTTQAQAIVKIMAGAELGLPPFASMTGINIVQGRPTLGANLIATLVKNDPRYNYKIKVATDKECVIEWFEDGKLQGESVFTMQEAIAGNINKNWDKEKNEWKDKPTWKAYPSDMLFARAISRGARRYAPGIFGGSPVYTPDEMGIDTNEEGMIEAVATEVVPQVVPPDNNGHEPRVSTKQANDDLGFAAPPPPDEPMVGSPYKKFNVTVDQARNVVGSDGVKYGDVNDKELKGKRIGIVRKLGIKNLTDDEKNELLYKVEAIDVLLSEFATVGE